MLEKNKKLQDLIMYADLSGLEIDFIEIDYKCVQGLSPIFPVRVYGVSFENRGGYEFFEKINRFLRFCDDFYLVSKTNDNELKKINLVFLPYSEEKGGENESN